MEIPAEFSDIGVTRELTVEFWYSYKNAMLYRGVVHGSEFFIRVCDYRYGFAPTEALDNLMECDDAEFTFKGDL